MTIRWLPLTLSLVVAALAGASGGSAGGIADVPCGNVAGENTNTCQPGEVGAPYSVRFVEEEGSGCGPGRQTFRFDSGMLPPGLALATDGTLSGIPTQAGAFRFYVELLEPQDDPATCAGKRTQKQFALEICDRVGIVSVPEAPPAAEARVPFRIALSWCGGVGALTWRISAGALPAGMALRPSGAIAGAPRIGGAFPFAATATDIRGQAATYTSRIVVAPRLSISPRQLPAARAGRAYRAALSASGGVAPRRWRVDAGRLPRGLRLDPELGVLAGTPAKPGTRRITVEARDALDARAKATVNVVVASRGG